MEPKILFMGLNLDYVFAKTAREDLEKVISKYELIDRFNSQFYKIVKNLADNEHRIDAHKLKHYGGTITINRNITKLSDDALKEKLIETLEKFFNGTLHYAQKHSAPFVLLQQMKLKIPSPDKYTFISISGLAQLLIEYPNTNYIIPT